MKKILVAIASLSLICAQADAQAFLNKLKEKAEQAAGAAMGGFGIPGQSGKDVSEQAGSSKSAKSDDPNSVSAVSGEQALPPKRASTFGWDGPVTPSSAKFPIPLMNEFPAIPSAAELINPVEANQIEYYKAIKRVTLRAEELNESTTCEDTETTKWRETANQSLKDAFGLDDADIALINKGNLTPAEEKRLEEKISKASLGGMDPSALEADAKKFENMSEADMEAMMKKQSLNNNAVVYDRNASDIRKYMGVSASELKAAAEAQTNAADYTKPCPQMKALQAKVDAYQKAESAKNPSFMKEAKAFEKRMQDEIRAEGQKSSRSMMGGMGAMMDAVQNTQAKMAPFMEMQAKMQKYVEDVSKLAMIPDAEADASFAAAERKKVLNIKNQIYSTGDPSVYNPLYLQALELIMSYRERAAKVWVADLQKRFNTMKENTSALIKLNRQAVEDGIIPDCALWRMPLNHVLNAGDLLAEAYSEFPSNYPKMYKEEIVLEVDLSSVPKAEFGSSENGAIGWWPEFSVFGPAYYDDILAGKYVFASNGDSGGIFQWNGSSWKRLSAERIKELNKFKETAKPSDQSWTSQDGKRKVYYNAEGGFIQLPEGDQVFPDSWKKVGNSICWLHVANEDTGNGNFKYRIVKCIYKL